MSVLFHPAAADEAAAQLVRQHAVREPFAALSGKLAPPTHDAAYQVQDAFVAQLSQQRGTAPAGYKIALTTPAMRAMVGFADSVSGRLFGDRIFRSGHTVEAREHVRLVVEFEIAFRMARDLPATDVRWTRESILAQVECAHPALEIADDRGADYGRLGESVLTLIADNAWNQGLVLGPAVTGRDAPGLLALEGIASIDEREVGRGSGRDVMGHPLDALAWLANHVQARGLALKAGDIVTTGSLVRSQFPIAGNRIAFKLPGFGEVGLDVA